MTSRLLDFFSASPKAIDSGPIRTRLSYFVLARVLVISILLVSSGTEVILGKSSISNTGLLFTCLGFLFFFSLINAWAIRKSSSISLVALAQLLLDVSLVTISIYALNPLIVVSLYLVVILSSSLVLNRNRSLIIASLCGLGYAAISNSILPYLPKIEFGSSGSEIFTVYLSMLGVSLMSSFLSWKLEKTSEIADKATKNLSKLSETQKTLLEEVSDGIITLDLKSSITGINEAAKAILGIAELSTEELIGCSLHKTLKDQGIEGLDSVMNTTENNSIEISASDAQQRSMHLNCSVKTIKADDGISEARMLVISDLSILKQTEKKLALHEHMAKIIAGSEISNLNTETFDYFNLIGSSQAMKEVFKILQKVSASSASVLISGESGTGKELIARAIHFNSDRADRPFVAINCGAIPESLIESELFGHKKGSFTGAINDSIGLFRQANNGTIFLDEVGELPLHLQSKLLRVLQERTVRSVGDTKDTLIDVRVLAATNRDLKQEVKVLKFRDDLYYRLNVVGIDLPPLRERREDIPFLVNFFVKKFTNAKGETSVISPQALQLLSNYNFPGNIRELENIIERAIVLGGKAILPEHLSEEIQLKSDFSSVNSYPEKTVNLAIRFRSRASSLRALLYLYCSIPNRRG